MSALIIHTADEDGANSDDQFSYVTGGVTTELDNEGVDDRERGQIDTYSVPNADSGVFAIYAVGSDGWKIDSISYGGLPVDMASCNGGSVWLDNPCTAGGYGSTPTPCVTELTIDTTSLAVTNCPHMMTVATPDINNADTDGAINMIGDDGVVTELEIDDFDDRERGQTDTYFIPLVSEYFTMEAATEDGWLFDKLTYDGSVIDMSSCPNGKLWLDQPCSDTMYGDYACLESVTVNVQSLAITDCPKYIEFHTCDISWAGSEEALSITGVDVDGSGYTVDLTTDQRSKDETNTYVFAAVDLPTTLTINSEGTDGWCIDAVTVDGIAIDMSDLGGGAWFDVCSGYYNTYGCVGSSLTLDLTSGTPIIPRLKANATKLASIEQ